MYVIKSKQTGQYASQNPWVFEPCNGKLPPVLYTREWDAIVKCKNLQVNLRHSEELGFAAATDELKVVEVVLIEWGDVKASPNNIPADWEQLSLYP